jgi:magnesium transporter
VIASHPSADLATAVWIDLLSPSAEESEKVHAATRLRVPTELQISEIESSSRLAFENGAFYLSTPLVSPQEDGEHVVASVGFVLSARVLVTVRFANLPSFDAAQTTCSTQATKTAEEVFLRIFETIVDRSADKLEHAGAECDDLSKSAFRAAGRRRDTGTDLSTALRRIGKVSDKMAHVRDTLLGIGRLVAYVMESGIEGAPTVNAPRLKAIRADVASLTDYEGHLAGKVQFLLDATLGYINIEQNEIVKTLTIASVVGIPPVLVAGIYGMNFHFMPELSWYLGYPMALAVIVVSGIIPYLWFKKRGWM